ncbi:hypothetical protein H6G45_07380 [Synechocystis sp. FACHB-383]|uniref:hypothetical protein n=1 Tax=Synechocystis sp. FACHB-383 TaxID=2692864 RepID=UPI001682EA15|nr:hypothetical protein [Synechocystis sp. FACHB-383]MBD2653313.1 hypothetical protein [Synechocystis sp. FACHB-383]
MNKENIKLIDNKSVNPQIFNLVLVLFSLFCLGLYSSFGRPLWIDEFLHFALGSYETTGEAWHVIRESILEINHGQTGIYMIINYWLMQIFGASTFWLRFPSLLSGLGLMLSTLYLFRLWQISFLWQFIGIMALGSQTQLMYFVGEARPYMPLVSATVCTLAYYSTPINLRSKFIFKIFGTLSVLIGVLFHPYFCIYWLGIVIFTYLQKLIEATEKFSFKSAIQHINVLLLLGGCLIFILLGESTWLRGGFSEKTNLDPFQWIKSEQLFTSFFQLNHLEFLQSFLFPLIIASMTPVLLVACIPRLRSNYFKSFVSPILLMIFALAASILLSYISYLSNYWIMSRQWVASMALFPLGFVWLGYRISVFFSRINSFLALLWIAIFFSPIIFRFGQVIEWNIKLISEDISQVEYQKKCPLLSSEQLKYLESIDYFGVPNNIKNEEANEYWVCLANQNVRYGGKVWKGFRSFYGKKFLTN